MTNEFTPWCKSLMANLAEGGVWQVPRSGLIYQKRGGALVLITRKPCPPSLGKTCRADWADYQDNDHAHIGGRFEAAGFEVHDETKP